MSAPRRSALTLVRVATLVLPPGELRERYRQEVLAELHDLDAADQTRHALGFASRAWSLRRAVSGREAGGARAMEQPAPWHCRLHLYHHDRLAFTEDGGRYLRCADCGRDGPSGGGRTNDSAGWAGAVNANNL